MPSSYRGGGRGIALPILDHDARRGWVVSATPWPLYPQRDQVRVLQEAGWVLGLVWMGLENLAAVGLRTPDHPDCSELLYRLCYPGHHS